MKSLPRKKRKHGGILNSILYIALLPLYLLGKIFPRDKRLLAFGSAHGEHFIDNPKYLFIHCSRHLKDTRCVFLSKNREVVERLTRCGYSASYTYSLRGLYLALRAGTCFVSHSTHDIHLLLVGGARIIQLWHGTPLKLIGHDVLALAHGSRQKIKRGLRKLLFSALPYLLSSLKYDKVIISSEYTRDCYKGAFRASDNQLLVCGQPRNDALNENYKFDQQLFPEISELEELRKKYARVITWMPTHRLRSGRGTAGLLQGYSFNAAALEELLNRFNAVLITKVHFLDASALAGQFAGGDRLRIYSHADPYPLLRYTDILMTDYSSVFFDFLLVNRPIVYTCFDRKEYVDSDASFYHDYDSVTPGQKCRDWNETIQAIAYHLDCLNNSQQDSYAGERQKICRLFNDFNDDFSRRVVDTTL